MQNLFFFQSAIQPYYNEKHKVLIIKGLLGTFYLNFKEPINLKIGQENLTVDSALIQKSYRNTYFQIVNNFCLGLIKGFKRYLVIKGLGYRTRKRKNWILFKLGYSHLIRYRIPTLIRLKRIKKGKLKLISVNWQLLKQTVNMIRSFKKPDVYKGKGIRYKGENFKLKLGKRSKK